MPERNAEADGIIAIIKKFAAVVIFVSVLIDCRNRQLDADCDAIAPANSDFFSNLSGAPRPGRRAAASQAWAGPASTLPWQPDHTVARPQAGPGPG